MSSSKFDQPTIAASPFPRLPIGTILLFVVAIPLVLSGCGRDGVPASKSDSVGTISQHEDSGNTASPAAGETDQAKDIGTRILFFGDSITAGYGLAVADQAFPYVFERVASERGYRLSVTAAGNSGETTAGGLRRIDWVLRSPFDVVVIELGGNDGLRGVPIETIHENLNQLIATVRDRLPEARIVIAGMRLPPSLGAEYVSEFETVYSTVAKENDVSLIPFILEGVAGNPQLNQADGIHPTASGHEIIGERVADQLESILTVTTH